MFPSVLLSKGNHKLFFMSPKETATPEQRISVFKNSRKGLAARIPCPMWRRHVAARPPSGQLNSIVSWPSDKRR